MRLPSAPGPSLFPPKSWPFRRDTTESQVNANLHSFQAVSRIDNDDGFPSLSSFLISFFSFFFFLFIFCLFYFLTGNVQMTANILIFRLYLIGWNIENVLKVQECMFFCRVLEVFASGWWKRCGILTISNNPESHWKVCFSFSQENTHNYPDILHTHQLTARENW